MAAIASSQCVGTAASTNTRCKNTTTNPNGWCGKCTGSPLAASAVPAGAATADDPFGDIDGFDEETIGPRTEFLIPEENLDRLWAKIAKMTDRAEKLGVPAPHIEVIETLDIPGDDGMLYRHKRVKVTGDSPSYDGWRMRAVVDLDPTEAGAGDNVVHVIGVDPGDPEWRTLGDVCDHCNKPGKGRHKLVVVRHDNGDEKVVGTTCLRDFLGSKSPAQIAAWAEMLSTVDDLAASYETGDGRGEPRLDPEDYLAWVARDVRVHGWVPRSQREVKTPSADAALDAIRLFAKKGPKSPEPPTDDDEKVALEALEWARSIEADHSTSDYLLNVRAVAAKSGWRMRDVGVGASIVAAYQRDQQKKTETESVRAKAIAAGHFGTIGEKAEFVAEVTTVRTIEGMFGPKRLVIGQTPEGHRVKWWASGRKIPEQGSTYAFKATVKGHEEWDDMPETVVTRARFEEIDHTA